jgi:hypothetical protein
VIGWLTGLSLRLKLYGLAALSVLVVVSGLWARMRIASARAAKWKSQAEALEATHTLQRDVAISRQRLREQQAKVRAEIAGRTERDAFEDQGWGP